MNGPTTCRYCSLINWFFALCFCLISCKSSVSETPQRVASAQVQDGRDYRDNAHREESDDIPKEEWDEELLESRPPEEGEYRRGDVCVLFVDRIRDCMDDLVDGAVGVLGKTGAQPVSDETRALLRETLSNVLKDNQMLDACQQMVHENPSELSATKKEFIECAYLRNCKEFAACFLRMATSFDQNVP